MNCSRIEQGQSLQRVGMNLGRALLGVLFVASGLLKMGRFAAVAASLERAGLPFEQALAVAVILFEVVAGLALVLAWRTKVSAVSLAIFVFAATLLFHRFWDADAAAFGNQVNHFLKNLALIGALLMLASVDCIEKRDQTQLSA